MALLDGYQSKLEIAADLGVTERTIDNYISRGMPFVQLGFRKLFKLESVTAWISGLECQKNQPKARGRRAA